MSGAWHTMDIYDNGDHALVVHRTNDDEDRGYPNTYASWDTTYPSVEAALKACGSSRVGISGIEVRVTLNGEPVF